jgi:hypothetical protein
MVVITYLHKFDEVFYKRSHIVNLYIEIDGLPRFKEVLAYLRANHKEVSSVDLVKPKSSEISSLGLFVTISFDAKQDEQGDIENIRALEGVTFVEELNW